MGNAWLDFLAEERGKDENKDVPMLELAGHVRPKYDAWKMENGIESNNMEKDEVEEDKMEVEVVVVKKGKSMKRKGKSMKRKGKKGKKSRKTRKH
jgi:hypothetical protein